MNLRTAPPMRAPQPMTDLEARLAAPDGAAVAQTLLLQLDALSLRVTTELRRRSPPDVFKQLFALRQALDAAQATIRAFAPARLERPAYRS